MPTGRPPAYAWDWFARQRLLWRECSARLANSSSGVADRYRQLDARSEVMPLLRADYPREPQVSETVHAVITELVFLGRTDRRFVELGVVNAPRGLRWWWTAPTGEDLQDPSVGPHRSPHPQRRQPRAEQLHLDDILQGYGDQ